MRAADDAVTAYLHRTGGRQRHGDGIGVDIQADEQPPGLRTLRRNVSQGGGGVVCDGCGLSRN